MWGSAEGVAVGAAFDACRSAPALLKVLDTLEVEGKSVVIPGCGRGYDLVEFGSRKASKVVGLEISPSAVRCAHHAADPMRSQFPTRAVPRGREREAEAPPGYLWC